MRTGRLSAWARALALGLSLSCAWCLFAGLASAAAGAESAEYRSIVERAVQEFQAGNYAEARGLFMRAHALYPNARTHRGLGLVAFELRNYRAAVEHLQLALESKERPLTEDQRRSTAEALDKARDYIALVKLRVTPASARVLVDGIAVDSEAEQALVFEVGDHVLEVQATGYLPERRVLTIAGRENTEVQIALPPIEQSQSASVLRTQERNDDGPSQTRRWYKSPWLWAATAVVVAGAGAGLAVGLRHHGTVERQDHSKLPNMPATGGVLGALGAWQ